MDKTDIVELVECGECGARDWKIYLEPVTSQDGCECPNCEDGLYHVHKRFVV